jgi:hypothetical protein
MKLFKYLNVTLSQDIIWYHSFVEVRICVWYNAYEIFYCQ